MNNTNKKSFSYSSNTQSLIRNYNYLVRKTNNCKQQSTKFTQKNKCL